MVGDAQWLAARACLKALGRHSSAFVVARALGDELGAFIAAVNGRHALHQFKSTIREDLLARPELLPDVERVVKEHEDILLTARLIRAKPDDANRVLRWVAAHEREELALAHDPDLFETTVRDRTVEPLDFDGLTVVESIFAATALRASNFDNTVLERCTFMRGDLSETSWRNARVYHSAFHDCTFTDACLDGAVFFDCVFNGSRFNAVGQAGLATARMTRFARCDLRNTTWQGRLVSFAHFENCAFHGVIGQPFVDTTAIDEPDLSAAGDGSVVGTASDVLELWGFPRWPSS